MVSTESSIKKSDQEAEGRVFGITDLENAKKNGFGLSEPPVSREGRPKMTPAVAQVLFGAEKNTINGKEIPQGGCLGESRTKLYGSPSEESKFVLADRLAIVASQDAAADSRVAQYMSDWSSCVKKQGFDFDSIDKLMSSFQRDPQSPPSAGEIEAAVADIECKEKTDLIAKWRLVGIEKEQTALEKNQLALTEERKALDESLAKAAEVLGKEL